MIGKLVVVRLEGGLGNQLFQVAYGISKAFDKGGRVLLDNRLIVQNSEWNGSLDKIVDIPKPTKIETVLIKVVWAYAGLCIRAVKMLFGSSKLSSEILSKLAIHYPASTRYMDLGPLRTPFVYVHGNFMSEKYFLNAKEAVRSIVRPSLALRDNSLEVVERITGSESVAVHIRRGDYLSNKWRNKLHICNEKYYKTAISIIEQRVNNPKYFIFTTSEEDADWIRDNYRMFPEDTEFVSNQISDKEHFAIMSSCKHFIISNSTFSWWASYLSINEFKNVVAPKPWNRNAWDMQDIYLCDWLLVDIDTSSVL